MRRFIKRLHRGEKGFTLIELLIVVAILGIIAAVVIPNAAGFLTAGTLNAANTEAQNVRTAAIGYMAENDGTCCTSSTDLGEYLTGSLKAEYTINATSGSITGATAFSDGWTGITWVATDDEWQKS